jgi:hypothetical protein
MTTNNTTTATTPNAPREFDFSRKHGVGQFLRTDTQAAAVMRNMRKDAAGMFSIQARAALK